MNLLDANAIRQMARPWRPDIGIYFLLCGDQVIYVGKSTNVLSRVLTGEHSKLMGLRYDAWAWLPCDAHDLAAMERRYINALNPTGNRDHTTLKARGIQRRRVTEDPRAPRGREIITPAQHFANARVAASVHGITRQEAHRRAADRRKGWKFAEQKQPRGKGASK